MASGQMECSAGTNCGVTISDGTTNDGNYWAQQSNAGTPERPGFTVSGRFTYSTGGARTFQLYGARSSGTQNMYNNQGGQNETQFKVYRFPSSQELAFRPDQVAWRVDANISGGNISLGTSAQTSYVSPQSSTLTLTQNTGSVGVQIGCDSTNPPTGTTCAAGNEQPDVSFTVPSAGDVIACASFSVVNGGANQDIAFQIVETAINAQTILQEGNSRLDTTTGSSSGTTATPFRLCGTFKFSSAGQKMLRLKYEQVAQTAAPSIYADANGSAGQRDIHWEVYPISQAIPAPLLVNSIITPSDAITKHAYVQVGTTASPCTTGTCTLTSQSGTWITSVVWASTGVYTVTFSGAPFSAAPVCQVNAISASNTSCSAQSATTSGMTVSCAAMSGGGTAANAGFNLTCDGTR
jgi:hypothetical protein